MYAQEQFAHQHCGFLFQILICGSKARFFRWDRSSALVTQAFDYVKEPRYLLEFLLGYMRLGEVERGLDPSVRLATTLESDTFRKAVEEFI